MSHIAWFHERKLDFIEDHLVRDGRVSTGEVAAYFGLSRRRARDSIAAYRKLQPNVAYKGVYKAYVRRPGFEPVRGSSAERQRSWSTFSLEGAQA